MSQKAEMEDYVRKELDALERMVLNWKGNHLGFATPDGNNDFLVEEFQEEITTYMSPYLRRLYQCEYITLQEAEEFMNWCYDQVDDLRRLIQELETPPMKPGFLQRLIGRTKQVWR